MRAACSLVLRSAAILRTCSRRKGPNCAFSRTRAIYSVDRDDAVIIIGFFWDRDRALRRVEMVWHLLLLEYCPQFQSTVYIQASEQNLEMI